MSPQSVFSAGAFVASWNSVFFFFCKTWIQSSGLVLFALMLYNLFSSLCFNISLKKNFIDFFLIVKVRDLGKGEGSLKFKRTCYLFQSALSIFLHHVSIYVVIHFPFTKRISLTCFQSLGCYCAHIYKKKLFHQMGPTVKMCP